MMTSQGTVLSIGIERGYSHHMIRDRLLTAYY
jgi:hypothetical protein